MKLLGKNINEQTKKESKQKMPLSKKYLRERLLQYAVDRDFFVAIVVVINMIVGKLPSKYTQIDISDQQLYSIGDETKKVLNNLDKDVTIYHIAQSGSEDETISNLLQKYADESKHVKVSIEGIRL